MKIITSKVLTDVNTQSKNYQFNRTLSDEFIAHLDPAGLNVLNIALFSHNDDHAQIRHHRCRLYAKFENSLEPVEVFLDIAIDTYNRLTTIQDVEWKDSVLVG
jgi:hypothetical protein